MPRIRLSRRLSQFPPPRNETSLQSIRVLTVLLVASLGVFWTSNVQGQVTATKERTTRTTKSEIILQTGDHGPAVEELQLRLNRRLKPSPDLTVDGDFGAATRSALIAFQKSKNLDPSGQLDPTTRDALGTQPIARPEPPSPEVVNRTPVAKAPADSLDGPPFVSAKAWVIADGRTGKALWGDAQTNPLPMASTTKMMTALVVARIADQDPKALDELVTFSRRADNTTGTTAGIRAGERVKARDLLYGLMLPSGNDASVAFGEHFGARLGSGTASDASKNGAEKAGDSLTEFIAEMNRVASELGMRQTHFANTHGLTAEGHHTSAADLAVLAAHVLRHPMLGPVVSTSKHGAIVTNAEGNPRNIAWSNTNRLLSIEGYDGVKTGTTNAAGACLVASGHREGGHLIVVVLGASNSENRYLDARNLFRWGWNQRLRSPSKVGGQ